MRTELRSGLVEVPGGLPTFASAGFEARAVAIGRIAADAAIATLAPGVNDVIPAGQLSLLP